MLAGRPHGSTTRRWVMCKHQGYASLAACGTTYAGNAMPISGSGINPELSRNLLDHGVEGGLEKGGLLEGGLRSPLPGRGGGG